MNNFEQTKKNTEKKNNIYKTLGLDTLSTKICERLVLLARLSGWNTSDETNENYWTTRTGMKCLVRGAFDLRNEMSKQGAISRRLDQLITTWQGWLPE